MSEDKEQVEPIEDNFIESMNELASILDSIFNAKWKEDSSKHPREYGFSLFVFPFGENPENRINFISNTNREDMLQVLREFISKHQ